MIKTSQVSKVREENPQRSFYVLEQLHVLPNITYLAKVRNTDEIIERGEHHGEEEVNKVPTGEPEKRQVNIKELNTLNSATKDRSSTID